MTTVKLIRSKSGYVGFEVRGHTGWSINGDDILCAAISSAVQLVANGITECAGEKACVKTEEDTVRLRLKSESSKESVQVLFEAFRLHMSLLAKQYEDNISIEIVEV